MNTPYYSGRAHLLALGTHMGLAQQKARPAPATSPAPDAADVETAPPGDNAWLAQQIPESVEASSSLLDEEPPSPAGDSGSPSAAAVVATPAAEPAIDVAALDAEFEEVWRTTDRAGTDAWLDALATRHPIDVHTAKAAEYRTTVTERRAERDARAAASAGGDAETPQDVLEVAPPAAAAGPVAAEASEGTEEAAAEGEWDLADAARVAQFALNPVGTTLGLAAQALQRWWSAPAEPGEVGVDPVEAPQQAAPEPETPAPTEDHSDKKDLLETAIDYAGDTSPAHPQDGVADDVTGRDRKAEILEGNADELATMKCSEFTSAVLIEAGWNLRDPYRDPATGLPVAYVERTHRAGKSVLYFVSLYDVVNMYQEATRAALDAQKGLAERVDPGSARSEEFSEPIAEPILIAGKATFVGEAVDANDEFGAGLAAQALGGAEVDPADRRPGDLQQRLTVKNDKYAEGGHSSIVYDVRGTGVAWIGDGGPEVRGTVSSPGAQGDLPDGWYEIPDGSTLRWIVGKDTDPDKVATLAVTDVTLADSSNNRRDGEGGFDATAVGEKSRNEGESVLSNGRLPNSPWFGWSADASAVPLGILQGAAEKKSG